MADTLSRRGAALFLSVFRKGSQPAPRPPDCTVAVWLRRLCVAVLILLLATTSGAVSGASAQPHRPPMGPEAGCPTQTTPLPMPITLNVTLQRPNAPPPHPSWAVPVHFALYPPGDANTICHEWDLTLDESGQWSGWLVLFTGLYDARLKNPHTLRNVRRNVNIGGPMTIDMGELHEGDANDDNRVRITDFAILRSAYFTDEGDLGFDPRADFDEDNRIRITDFALLRMNYFQDGDIEVSLAAQSIAHGMDAVDVCVEPPAVATTIGETFMVTVMVKAGAQDVVGADFDLRFQPAFLQVVDAAGQPATRVEAAGPLSELFNRVDPAAGRIRYAAGTFDVVNGTFPLAILRFKALAATQATALHFVYADVVAPGGESVLGELGDGTVSITQVLQRRYLPLLLRSG
ncbi:MAG: cohesin domain-containing protein [Anaerolineae bacterium]|nr:cohesin domain-containing protein [Anaerolineae bacterium]